MIQAPTTHLLNLHAFAQTCPDATDVKAVLADLGFALVFSMDAMIHRYKDTPPLPAQYHFKDNNGTEVIFLAGHDGGEDGRWMPPHASRWWLYARSSQFAYGLAVNALRSRWGLPWQSL